MKKNFFLNIVTQAINRYLQLDPATLTRLQELDGRSILMIILPFQWNLQLSVTKEGIKLSEAPDDYTADTIISGTPLQLFSVAASSENRHRFFAEDLKITGDAATGQKIIELFDTIEIDWEEKLARVIGDIPAVQMSKWVRKINHWFKETEQALSENISEYLHEESKLLPAPAELQDYYNDIDNLRMDVDRFEARFNAFKILSENESEK